MRCFTIQIYTYGPLTVYKKQNACKRFYYNESKRLQSNFLLLSCHIQQHIAVRKSDIICRSYI